MLIKVDCEKLAKLYFTLVLFCVLNNVFLDVRGSNYKTCRGENNNYI